MAERLQKPRLLERLFFLAFRHPSYVNHFHYTHVSIVDTPHLKRFAEGALAQQLDFLVSLELGSFLNRMHLLLHHF